MRNESCRTPERKHKGYNCFGKQKIHWHELSPRCTMHYARYTMHDARSWCMTHRARSTSHDVRSTMHDALCSVHDACPCIRTILAYPNTSKELHTELLKYQQKQLLENDTNDHWCKHIKLMKALTNFSANMFPWLDTWSWHAANCWPMQEQQRRQSSQQ